MDITIPDECVSPWYLEDWKLSIIIKGPKLAGKKKAELKLIEDENLGNSLHFK